MRIAGKYADWLMDTTPDAGEALRRSRFAHDVTEELDEIRRDTDAWDDYLADAEQTSVRDGID